MSLTHEVSAGAGVNWTLGHALGLLTVADVLGRGLAGTVNQGFGTVTLGVVGLLLDNFLFLDCDEFL